MSFRDLKVGDKVKRTIGPDEESWMDGTVMAVEGDTLKVAMTGTEGWPLTELWTFHRDYGCEEDHELGWGFKFGRTGSKIKKLV